MKKKKTNVVHLNKKKKKSARRIEQDRRRKELEEAVHEFFYAYDPNPPIGEVRSSEVYENFIFYSLVPCSKKQFGGLARKYVRAEKGKNGLMFYTLLDHVLMHLLSIRDDVASSMEDDAQAA